VVFIDLVCFVTSEHKAAPATAGSKEAGWFLSYESPKDNTENVTFSSQTALAKWFFDRCAIPAFDRPQERNDLYCREGN
jgi:hypothetical protein